MPTETIQDIQLRETHVKDYWDVLVRRKWIVLSFTVLCTLVVGVLTFTMTPLYKASATIVVENEGSDVLNPSDNGAKGVSFDIFENYLQTQMSLILSRSVAGKVFEDLNLAADPRYLEEGNPVLSWMWDKWRAFKRLFSTAQTGEGELKSDPLIRFLKDIELTRLKGTRAIKIAVYNPDAQTAANIANALADRYSRDNLMRRALTFIRNQRMASLNADYLRLQSKYDALSNQYGPKHHKMIALRDEIRTLAARIEMERQKELDPSAAATETAEATASAEEAQMLEDILRQIQESSVLSSSQMNNIMIADPAVPPTRVAKPNKIQNLLIGLFAGLVVGIFLAFFVDYLDDTIKSEEDLKKVIGGGANFMGTIPYDKHIKGFRRLSKLDRLVLQRPLSESAEAYRLVRIQLHWHLKKNPDFKDFAIVSSMPDEGKSTISSNISIALAQLNKKVLLVDTDIRRGRLHRTYGTAKKKGLGQYLSEDLPFEAIIQPTKIPNLSIVTPGESMIMGAELLSSAKMSEFIELTRKHFDMVVYDTPPVTLISDASILLSQIHGAILVTRMGVTRSRIVPKTIAMIRNANTTLLGVVLNSSGSTENKYYHRYYKE